MSRRCHHGSPRHVPLGRAPRRPATALPDRPAPPTSLAAPPAPPASAPFAPRAVEPPEEIEVIARVEPDEQVEIVEPPVPSAPVAVQERPVSSSPAPRPMHPRMEPPRPGPRQVAVPEPIQAHHEGEDRSVERTTTAPQLRRFIKSRAYVPMHELRRRFVINGGDDDVTPVDIERKRIFVGLPEREGRLLGELLRSGDIGYELSMDPISPIVVGVYPMRPVTRS